MIAYEIDGKLYESLKPQLSENVRLYRTDFLNCPLPKTPYKVFANIPFSRTTEILRKLKRREGTSLLAFCAPHFRVSSWKHSSPSSVAK